MDKINFTAKDNFPFSIDTANMMQDQTMLAAKMALLGDTVTRAQYPELAFSLGKENEQSFVLPDLRKRFIVGYDNAVNSGYNQMWDTGGQETVTLTIPQMPKHSHTIKFVDEKWGDNANSRPFPNPAGTAGYSADTTQSGDDQPHENRPPFYVLAYVIKVK